MTYSVLVRAGAERDIEEAVDWYSANAPEQAGGSSMSLARRSSEFENIHMRSACFVGTLGGRPSRFFVVVPYQIWFDILPVLTDGDSNSQEPKLRLPGG